MTGAVLATKVTRDARLTARVNAPEAERIALQAATAGLSISAYLRDRALGLSAQPDEAAALRQMDALVDRMRADLDCAIVELASTIARMDEAA
jgi:hypothetical protein